MDAEPLTAEKDARDLSERGCTNIHADVLRDASIVSGYSLTARSTLYVLRWQDLEGKFFIANGKHKSHIERALLKSAKLMQNIAPESQIDTVPLIQGYVGG